MFERSGELLGRKFREYLPSTLLTMMAVSLATVVDSIIVGNLLGEVALSAVGLSMPVINFTNMIFLFFTAGGAACAAIAKGRREEEKANRIFTFTFTVGIAVMAVVVTVLFALRGPLAASMSRGNPEVEGLLRAYLGPIVFCGVPMMASMGVANFARTDGFPRTSAVIAIVANVVNLILDYALIRFFGFGIEGAAISTVVGYVVGCFVLIPYFRSKTRTFRFVRVGKSDAPLLLDILRVGTPRGLFQGMSMLRGTVMNSLIMATLGPAGMSAMALCNNAQMLAVVFISGTNDTLLPIVGTLYGEKDYRGIRFTVKTSVRVMLVTCLSLLVIFLAVPQAVGWLFGIRTAGGVAAMVPALRLYALSLPFYGLTMLLQNFFQTTGRVKLSVSIVVMHIFLFVVLFAFPLSQIGGGAFIWLAYLCAELSTLAVVWAVSVRIRKKEEVEGILLLPESQNAAELDISVPATLEAASGLSQQVIDFCKAQGAGDVGAARLGVAAEEMAANTARYGHAGRHGVIDVLVRRVGEEFILRLRDDGIPFDPSTYYPEEQTEFATGGIEVVRRLASEVSYSRQLGFNVTIIGVVCSALGRAPAQEMAIEDEQ